MSRPLGWGRKICFGTSFRTVIAETQVNPKKPTTPQPESEVYPLSAPPQEIHLRRLTVDEALERLKHYLQDADVAGIPRVRVIHGKGTGTLREAIWKFLSTHPLVKAYYMAAPAEGDGGVTIVELAE